MSREMRVCGLAGVDVERKGKGSGGVRRSVSGREECAHENKQM